MHKNHIQHNYISICSVRKTVNYCNVKSPSCLTRNVSVAFLCEDHRPVLSFWMNLDFFSWGLLMKAWCYCYTGCRALVSPRSYIYTSLWKHPVVESTFSCWVTLKLCLVLSSKAQGTLWGRLSMFINWIVFFFCAAVISEVLCMHCTLISISQKSQGVQIVFHKAANKMKHSRRVCAFWNSVLHVSVHKRPPCVLKLAGCSGRRD